MYFNERPNVLIIYTDQQRWDSLRCYGNEEAKTPNLDRLASKGTRLNKYFVQNPVCMPSRMSFLTGRYCSSLGVGANGIPFPESDAILLNQILKPYGYHTAQIGKLHFLPHAKRMHCDPHPNYGFDTCIISDEPGCYNDAYIKWVESISPLDVDKVRTSLPPAARLYGKKNYSEIPRDTHEPYLFEGDEKLTHSNFVTSEIIQYIRQHKEQPFFAIAGFYAPHPPLNPPKKNIEKFSIDEISLPKKGENEELMPELQNITPDKWKEIRAFYLALVNHVDECIGKIIHALEVEGLFENTIVIFTSDHGEFLGDHGRIQKGMPGYDCITRVPFIISYPKKIQQGMVIEELVEAVDVFPTVLDYCGVQTPREVQGKSFKPLLDGEKTRHRESVYTEYFEPYGYFSSTVRTNRYKYNCDTRGNEFLFDLEKDPYELNNLIGNKKYESILAFLRKQMVIRLQEASFKARSKEAEY